MGALLVIGRHGQKERRECCASEGKRHGLPLKMHQLTTIMTLASVEMNAKMFYVQAAL
jgi:hypothetical protein